MHFPMCGFRTVDLFYMVFFSALIGIICICLGVIGNNLWFPSILLVIACLAFAYIREMREVKEEQDNRVCKFCHQEVDYRIRICPYCGRYIGAGAKFTLSSMFLKFLALISLSMFVILSMLSAAYLTLKRLFPNLLDRYGL